MVEIQIAKGNYGMTYSLVFKGEDYTGCTASLYLWRGSNTIIDGGSCDVEVVAGDTIVKYLVTPGAFDVTGDLYNAKVRFVKAGFDEEQKMFNWRVIDQSG